MRISKNTTRIVMTKKPRKHSINSPGDGLLKTNLVMMNEIKPEITSSISCKYGICIKISSLLLIQSELTRRKVSYLRDIFYCTHQLSS